MLIYCFLHKKSADLSEKSDSLNPEEAKNVENSTYEESKIVKPAQKFKIIELYDP